MTWSTLPSFSDGDALTDAELQAIVANINETAPAKASGSIWPTHFVATGTNSIAEREIRDEIVTATESTSATTWVNLTTTGPLVNVVCGNFALVLPACRLKTSVDGQAAYASFELNGAGGVVGRGVINENVQDVRCTSAQLIAVTPGNTTFNMVYQSASGSALATFSSRRMCVMGL